jgi:hypothetical protein
MELFRKTSKSTLYLWVISLSIAVISAQGVTFHVHTLDHDHYHDQHNHPDQLTLDEHNHISIAHLSADNSHSDHHDQVIYENDACPDCLLTKISSKVPLTALLVALFILLLTGVYRLTYVRRRDDIIFFLRRPHFTPPLRAPPVK